MAESCMRARGSPPPVGRGRGGGRSSVGRDAPHRRSPTRRGRGDATAKIDSAIIPRLPIAAPSRHPIRSARAWRRGSCRRRRDDCASGRRASSAPPHRARRSARRAARAAARPQSAARSRAAAAGRRRDRRRAGCAMLPSPTASSAVAVVAAAVEIARPEFEVLGHRQRRLQRVLVAEIVRLLAEAWPRGRRLQAPAARPSAGPGRRPPAAARTCRPRSGRSPGGPRLRRPQSSGAETPPGRPGRRRGRRPEAGRPPIWLHQGLLPPAWRGPRPDGRQSRPAGTLETPAFPPHLVDENRFSGTAREKTL